MRKPLDSSAAQICSEGATKRERKALELFHGHNAIRQMLDEIEEPPGLVLEHLGGDLLSASREKQLERHEAKTVARTVLEALAALHGKDWVHTGKIR